MSRCNAHALLLLYILSSMKSRNTLELSLTLSLHPKPSIILSSGHTVINKTPAAAAAALSQMLDYAAQEAYGPLATRPPRLQHGPNQCPYLQFLSLEWLEMVYNSMAYCGNFYKTLGFSPSPRTKICSVTEILYNSWDLAVQARCWKDFQRHRRPPECPRSSPARKYNDYEDT